MYIHTDTKAQMLKETSSGFFLCRQGGRDAVRWKPSVTDEKSLASFLSLHLPPLALTLPPILFLFALSCALIIAAALSASDSISSLRFIVLHLFPSLFLIWSLFFSPLCFTLKEEIGTLSCNPSVVTLMPAPVLCLAFSSAFPPISAPSPSLHSPKPTPPLTLIHTYTHKYYFHSCPVSRLRNSQCIVGLDACICVCVCAM